MLEVGLNNLLKRKVAVQEQPHHRANTPKKCQLGAGHKTF
jgi:hypothetical protein